MKRLSIPGALAVLPLALGCSSESSLDAGQPRDVAAGEVADVEGDVADTPDTAERRCEGTRATNGVIVCPDGVFGLAFCVRVPCAADDGGGPVAPCCAIG